MEGIRIQAQFGPWILVIVDFLMVLRVLRVRDSRRGRGEGGKRGKGERKSGGKNTVF